jgi:hypothetical protein
MADNNFLQFDPTKNNMVSDATYNGSSYRANGAVAGVAPSSLHNKLFYQLSTFVAAFTDMMATIKNGGSGYEMSDSDITALTTQLANIVTVDQLSAYATSAGLDASYIPKKATEAKSGTYTINATTDMYKTFTTTGAGPTTFILPDPTTVANGAWIKIHNTNIWQATYITGLVSFWTNPTLAAGQEITIQCTGTSWIGTIIRRYDLPIGAIIPVTTETLSILTGFLYCDGSSLAVADYPELHTAIGYNYGGSGANFNIPDMRGRFLRCHSTNPAVNDPDYASRVRADGKVGHYVGGVLDDAVIAHTHGITTYQLEGTPDGYPGGDSSATPYGLVASTEVYSAAQETRPNDMTVLFGIKFAN